MASRTKDPKAPYVFPTRVPLVGQSADRESELRARLVEQFNPENAFEEMWLEDIAYCAVKIEHDRALIAAFKMLCVKRLYEGWARINPEVDLFESVPADFNAAMIAHLNHYADYGFIAPSGMPYLGDPSFGEMLGRLSRKELDGAVRAVGQGCEMC